MSGVSNILLPLLSVLLLLIAHALLVLGETSLILIRYGKVSRKALDDLAGHKQISAMLGAGARAGQALRFGKVLCLVGLGIQTCLMVQRYFSMDGPMGGAVWMGWLLVVSMLLLILYCGGSYFPRAMAMRYPVGALRFSAPLLMVLQFVLLPFRRFSLEQLVFKRFGVNDSAPDPMDTAVQLRALGEDNTRLSAVVRSIVSRAIQMQDLVVHDVLLPRNEVIIYDLNDDVATNLQRMKRAGHTRYPLCRGDMDECLGIIHIKDIFRSESGELSMNPDVLIRPTATFLLETPLEEALQRMLRTKFHMGIVNDAFGGALGVVTLERILEELVGDIQDEFDSEEDPIEDLRERGSYRISGQAPMHDVEARLGISMDNEEVSTFGGFIAGEMGRIPQAGERLAVQGLEIEIVRVDERRILTTQVRVVKGSAED